MGDGVPQTVWKSPEKPQAHLDATPRPSDPSLPSPGGQPEAWGAPSPPPLSGPRPGRKPGAPRLCTERWLTRPPRAAGPRRPTARLGLPRSGFIPRAPSHSQRARTRPRVQLEPSWDVLAPRRGDAAASQVLPVPSPPDPKPREGPLQLQALFLSLRFPPPPLFSLFGCHWTSRVDGGVGDSLSHSSSCSASSRVPSLLLQPCPLISGKELSRIGQLRPSSCSGVTRGGGGRLDER
ncbi:uncharacterized protein LOC105864809 [Microcebus murinus]|uniref:uncharacterized protein LOC105864809 n=1 Tax=Microcebus murinus TaxID=30608 RepID=UPI003F6DA115